MECEGLQFCYEGRERKEEGFGKPRISPNGGDTVTPDYLNMYLFVLVSKFFLLLQFKHY